MRFIELDEGLRLRFPGQSEDFSAGFEMGALAAFLSFGLRECTRAISTDDLDQARDIAESLHYRMIPGARHDDGVTVRFVQGGARPALRLVSRG
ncbi:MAG: hypothetical protein JWO64_2403 [Hyphomicrobiales bacterium]|jgi:hypothetical protein|nr:hypothetical protein [Hyphomicrobiales bacterium]